MMMIDIHMLQIWQVFISSDIIGQTRYMYIILTISQNYTDIHMQNIKQTRFRQQ